jgi:cold shock CspA family protein
MTKRTKKAMPTEGKMTGTVKFWDANRGFGFVTPDAGGEDLFCHIRSVPEHIEELREGQRVRFEEAPSQRKPGKFEAVAVEVV